MGERSASAPERPSSEPEILPPDHGGRWSARRGSGIWIAVDTPDGRRTAFAQPGPLSVFVGALVLCVIAALVFLFLLGALLIWIPVLVAVIAILLLSGLMRGPFRRIR